MKFKTGLGVLVSLTFLLSACGSESEQSEGFNTEPKNVNELALVDMVGNPIASLDLVITEEPAGTQYELESPVAVAVTVEEEAVSVLTTDKDGYVNVSGLVGGRYRFDFLVGDEWVTSYLVIEEGNIQAVGSLLVPVEFDDGELYIPDENSLLLSFSGVLLDDDKPIKNADFLVSGGVATNGVFVRGRTNQNGEYFVIVNIGYEALESLNGLMIIAQAEGYERETLIIDGVEGLQSMVGLNFQLTPKDDTNIEVYYRETFDTTAAEAVCGDWIAMQSLSQSNEFAPTSKVLVAEENPQVISEESNESSVVNLWHAHGGGLNIVNQAWLDGHVVLAPNDESFGAVPDPVSGLACWYGSDTEGDSYGNFLVEKGSAPEFELSEESSAEANENLPSVGGDLDGGTSVSANSGAIVSPSIDLRMIEGNVSLVFDTWWEIESVNPNKQGYDIMEIFVSDDDGGNWQLLKSLNPYNDPVTVTDNRDPRPFSNTGYFSAPVWHTVEPISLNEYQGSEIVLMFNFRTEDELYNGFRGWLVDNISITNEPGFVVAIPGVDILE